ncbi:hypothetical protein H5410_055592 [Solanum commersonii]|uniref:Uncharacterized protein n=1 Tax=Solanum commersonii TaxID=4109 RepID=A0A9J5WIR3_SOLCO|nr:hypothetical protein H5410_055592 [Solanum commersonii]
MSLSSSQSCMFLLKWGARIPSSLFWATKESGSEATLKMVWGACRIWSIRSGYFDQSQEKKLGKKSSVSWPRKVHNVFFDKVVMRSGCSMEKNREEAKLTRRERGGRAFFLHKNKGEKKAPWERTKDSAESFS